MKQRQSNSRQSAAIRPSSSRVNTLPLGLLGEFTMIAFVRGPNAARSSSGSNVKSSPRSVTNRSVAPLMAASGT